MADQNTSTRPTISVVVEAPVKFEESYEIWGQPPSDNEVKRATPRRKGLATTESSLRRRQTFVQHRDKAGTPAVLPRAEAEDGTPTQPVKRGLVRPNKNQFGWPALVEAEESTKEITLRVSKWPAFKETLRQIRDTEEGAGPSTESHFTSQAIIVESIADDAGADYSTYAESPNETAGEQIGSVSPNVFKPTLAKLYAFRQRRNDYSLDYVRPQVPEVLQDDIQNDASGPGARRIAAGSVEEAARVRTANLELESAPSESEIPREDGGHADWLEQLEAFARVQNGQNRATRFSTTASSVGIERMNTAFQLSPSSLQSSLDFAGTYHFRAQAIGDSFRRRTAAIAFGADENAMSPSAFREWARGPKEDALRTQRVPPILSRALATSQQARVLPGGQLFSKESSSKIQRSQTLYTGTPSTPRFTYEKQGCHRVERIPDFKHTAGKASSMKNTGTQSTSPELSERRSSLSTKPFRPCHEQDDDHSPAVHESINATPISLSKVVSSGSGVDELIKQRKLVSVHPPPMNRQTPNMYFDRNPRGSSIGTHSFDPFVELPDHSDPRTFYTPDSKEWPHVSAALQPSINHFRQLTDGAEPRQTPLDSGYEVSSMS